MSPIRGVLLAVILLSGCSVGTVREAYEYTPVQAMEVARNKADQGQWSDARLLMEVQVSRFPDHVGLQRARGELERRFSRYREDWEDRLLILRAQELVNRIPVLQQMNETEPLRLQVHWDLEQDKAELQQLRSRLLACGERQIDRELHLASDCARLADWVGSDEVSRRLVDLIALRFGEIERAQRNLEARVQRAEEEIKAQRQAEKQRHRARARKDRLEDKLVRAEQRLSQSAYAEAAKLIEEVLAVEPKNRYARHLQRKLDRTLAAQRQVLDDLASRYYTEGDIEAAIQVWETLLRMSPGLAGVEERLERARRVREKLKTVRAAEQDKAE